MNGLPYDLRGGEEKAIHNLYYIVGTKSVQLLNIEIK